MSKITELYAYVVEDADSEDEGIPAFANTDGFWLPLMGADLARAQSLRNRAQIMATAMGKPIKLIRSTGIEIIETIDP